MSRAIHYNFTLSLSRTTTKIWRSPLKNQAAPKLTTDYHFYYHPTITLCMLSREKQKLLSLFCFVSPLLLPPSSSTILTAACMLFQLLSRSHSLQINIPIILQHDLSLFQRLSFDSLAFFLSFSSKLTACVLVANLPKILYLAKWGLVLKVSAC